MARVGFFSYFNPCSTEHHAVKDFKSLKGKQKFAVITATFFGALASVPILGLGGVATFRKVVRNYTNNTSDKTDSAASSIQGKDSSKKEKIAQRELFRLFNAELHKAKLKGNQKKFAVRQLNKAIEEKGGKRHLSVKDLGKVRSAFTEKLKQEEQLAKKAQLRILKAFDDAVSNEESSSSSSSGSLEIEKSKKDKKRESAKSLQEESETSEEGPAKGAEKKRGAKKDAAQSSHAESEEEDAGHSGEGEVKVSDKVGKPKNKDRREPSETSEEGPAKSLEKKRGAKKDAAQSSHAESEEEDAGDAGHSGEGEVKVSDKVGKPKDRREPSETSEEGPAKSLEKKSDVKPRDAARSTESEEEEAGEERKVKVSDKVRVPSGQKKADSAERVESEEDEAAGALRSSQEDIEGEPDEMLGGLFADLSDEEAESLPKEKVSVPDHWTKPVGRLRPRQPDVQRKGAPERMERAVPLGKAAAAPKHWTKPVEPLPPRQSQRKAAPEGREGKAPHRRAEPLSSKKPKKAQEPIEGASAAAAPRRRKADSAQLAAIAATVGEMRSRRKRAIFNKGIERFHRFGIKSEVKAFRLQNAQDFAHSKRRAPAYFSEVLQENPYAFEVVEEYFGYEPTSEDVFDVFTDFANAHLGGGCFGGGFVQEEIMVAEFPDFADHIAQHTVKGRCSLNTREGGKDLNRVLLGSPNPYLVTGVHRVQHVNGYAEVPDISKVKRLRNPQEANILAVAAPKLHSKKIDEQMHEETVRDLFNTIMAGFTLVEEQTPEGMTPRIHSGRLGCGVFNNNATLVYLLHQLAAQHTGMDIKLYGYSDDEVNEANDIWESLDLKGKKLSECLELIADGVYQAEMSKTEE